MNDTHAPDLRIIGREGGLAAMHDKQGERTSPYFVPDEAAMSVLWTAVGCECCAPLPANDAAWEPEPEVA